MIDVLGDVFFWRCVDAGAGELEPKGATCRVRTKSEKVWRLAPSALTSHQPRHEVMSPPRPLSIAGWWMDLYDSLTSYSLSMAARASGGVGDCKENRLETISACQSSGPVTYFAWDHSSGRGSEATSFQSYFLSETIPNMEKSLKHPPIFATTDT